MASVGDSLWARLTGNAAVTAIIVKRLFPVAAPPNTTVPYGVHLRVDTPRTQAFGGPSGNVHALIEFTWVDTTPKKAEALADAARVALDGWSDMAGTPVIEWVTLENETQVPVLAKDRRYEMTQDFRVHYRE